MASDRYREKLLELIGKIGKDDRQGKTASKVSAVKYLPVVSLCQDYLSVCLSICLSAMEDQKKWFDLMPYDVTSH